MRALHVLETLAAGGVETTFLNVLRHLSTGVDGDRHDVLATTGGALEGEYRTAAARVHIAQPARWQPILETGAYDVIYILFERAALALMPLVTACTAARVVYGKNYDFSGQWRSTEGFEWTVDDALMSAADGVTFTTGALAAAYAGNASRGLVLGKAADVTPLLSLPLPEPGTPRRVLAIANPTPRKRLGDLVMAMEIVRRRIDDAELRVVGAGDPVEARRLRALADELSLGHAVRFAGATRAIRDELSQARIVALSSASEGVPTALLEGMAAARPVVTTDCGHVRTIVDDGVEGFVVHVGDVAALADRIAMLLGDPARAARMGAGGRARAVHHRVEAVGSRLRTYLHSIVAARN